MSVILSGPKYTRCVNLTKENKKDAKIAFNILYVHPYNQNGSQA